MASDLSNQDIFNEKSYFWRDYQQETIEAYLKYGTSGLSDSPHLILIEVFEEAKYNELQSSESAGILQTRISKSLGDIIIKRDYLGEFQDLEQSLKNCAPKRAEDISFLLLKKFSSWDYAKSLAEVFVQSILNEFPLTKEIEKIKQCINSLTTEFLLFGYSPKTIENFHSWIFDNFEEREGYIITRFPHEIPIDFEYKDEEKKKTVFEKIKAIMNSLDFSKRVSAFPRFLNTSREKRRVVLPIAGFKINDNLLKVGKVTFYNPVKKQFLLKPGRFSEEKNPELLFPQDQDGLNATVEIEFVDNESAVEDGVREIEEAIDLLRLFFNTKIPIEIISKNAMILDCQGNLRFQMGGLDKFSPIYWHLGLEVSTDECENTKIDQAKELLEKNYEYRDFIFPGLKARRKALNSNDSEEAFLGYWVSIESLFNERNIDFPGIIPGKGPKILFIREIISKFLAIRHFFEIGWRAFYTIESAYFSKVNGKRVIELPKDLVSKAQFGFHGVRYLDKFLDCIPELLKEIKNYAFNENLVKTKSFYEDPKSCMKELDRYTYEVSKEIQSLYRIRNMIVHRGTSNHVIVLFYLERIKMISNILFHELLKKGLEGTTDINSYYNRILLNYACLNSKLKQNEKIQFKDVRKY